MEFPNLSSGCLRGSFNRPPFAEQTLQRRLLEQNIGTRRMFDVSTGQISRSYEERAKIMAMRVDSHNPLLHGNKFLLLVSLKI